MAREHTTNYNNNEGITTLKNKKSINYFEKKSKQKTTKTNTLQKL